MNYHTNTVDIMCNPKHTHARTQPVTQTNTIVLCHVMRIAIMHAQIYIHDIVTSVTFNHNLQ